MTGVEALLAAGLAGAAETAGVAGAATAAGAAAGAAAGGGSILSTIGSVAGIGGSVLSGLGALSNAKATKDAQDAEAANLERQAKETEAAAQRNGERKRKQEQLVQSRTQALAAASGGSATDQTVLDLQATTAGEGELQADTIQYEGAARGRGLTYQAAIKRAAGENAMTAGYFSAGSSLLSGLSSWSRYRRGYYAPGASYADA